MKKLSKPNNPFEILRDYLYFCIDNQCFNEISIEEYYEYEIFEFPTHYELRNVFMMPKPLNKRDSPDHNKVCNENNKVYKIINKNEI